MAGPDAQANGHSNGDAGAPPPQQQQRPAGLSFAGLAGRGRPRGAALGVHGPAAVAQRQAISGFGEGVDAVPVAAADKPVIPRQEDTFVVGRPQSDRGGRQRNPNRFLPDRADAAPVAVEEKFEVAAEEVVGPVTYGLQLVVTKTETVTTAPGRDGSPGAGPSDALATDGGRLANGRGSAANETQALSVTSRDWEARKLHEDLHRLADDPDLDQYEAMPVEMFGEAMLRGMGWEAGKGVGRNKVIVVPKEYVPRPGRLGLGAEPAALQAKEKRYIKPGESREAKPDMVYLDADGHQRYTKGVDEKLVARQRRGPAPGKAMYIEGGRHSGFFCTVLAVEEAAGERSATATVRLRRSDTTVTVRCSDLVETNEAQAARDAARAGAARADARGAERNGAAVPVEEAQPNGRTANGHAHDARDESDRKAARKEAKREAKKERKREKEGKRDRQRDEEPGSSQKRRRSEERAPAEPPWLAADIRVRIIDKRLRGGALYLKKGVVADVHQPTVCDVVVDGARVSNVGQAQLETVVPAEGGKVLVLAGRHAREVGRVMRKAQGAAAVQLLSDHSVLKVVYEDISEYLGQDHD